MDIGIDVKDINQTCQIGTNTESKVYEVFRKMQSFQQYEEIKGKNLSITESFKKLWINKLRAARDEYGFQNAWRVVGKILYKADDIPDSKPAVFYQQNICNQSLSYAEKNSFDQRSFVLV